MKIAIVSDIHANMDALREVLQDIDAAQVDGVVSLGDHVGYGPEPEAVIAAIRKRGIPAVKGNHDLALTDVRLRNWLNPPARTSLELTLGMLSADALDWIAMLPPVLVQGGCRYVHGFPPDSVTDYLFEASQAKLRRTFEQMPERICFVGHTHDLELVVYDGRNADRQAFPKGITRLRRGHKYIISVGSVGQPRDGDNHAKYAVWDGAANTVELKYIAYDISAVMDKMRRAGLPEAHAARLKGRGNK